MPGIPRPVPIAELDEATLHREFDLLREAIEQDDTMHDHGARGRWAMAGRIAQEIDNRRLRRLQERR